MFLLIANNHLIKIDEIVEVITKDVPEINEIVSRDDYIIPRKAEYHIHIKYIKHEFIASNNIIFYDKKERDSVFNEITQHLSAIS